MTLAQGITTFIGAFFFSFAILLFWGRLVDKMGPKGGWIAALTITGTFWLLNHGMAKPLIQQTGVWVDMGLAVGVGCWVASAYLGGNIKKSQKNIATAVLAGFFGGIILALFS